MRLGHYSVAAVLALTLGSCLGLSPAQATLVNDGTYVDDTTTGLDWLDLTQTTGDSYNTVQTLLGSTLSGWSYATEAQVGILFNDAGGQGPYSFSGPSNGGPTNEAAAQLLVNLLGSTGVLGANSGQGLIGAADGVGGHFTSTYWNGAGFAYLLDCNCYVDPADGSSSPTVGSFLVRTDTSANGNSSVPSPEPATLAILSAGLTGLGAARRRKHG